MKFNGFGTENLVLPGRIDAYLTTAASILKSQGDLVAAELLKEGRAEVIPESHESWDGGQYYYRVELYVPSDSFDEVASNKSSIEDKIAEQLRKSFSLPNEFVSSLSLVSDPFRKSVTHSQLSNEDISRIWGSGTFRLFLSHKNNYKADVAKIKEELSILGVSCFVAHEDIEPNKEWQNEIERALNSMDMLVALLTKDFHTGSWTDQEIGFALGRGIPIIAVKLEGADPKGFISKYQAVSSDWVSASKKIAKLLFNQKKMIDAYAEAMRYCNNYDNANRLAEMLPEIKSCNETQIQAMLDAYNNNDQISGSFGFKGGYSCNGLAHHLHRLTGRSFSTTYGRIAEAQP